MTRPGALITLAALAAGCGGDDTPPAPWTAVTFNTGTTEGLNHDDLGDGYGPMQAQLSDEHYGDGLAWRPAIDDVQAFLTELQPDVIGFQEIFHSPDCAAVPPDARAGFVCETWTAGDPTVAQAVLGAGYQVACHPGKTDKCIGVRRAFGTIRGCAGDLCLEGLAGAGVDGCGRGARVAFADVETVRGEGFRVVHVHGSSGLTDEDVECRRAQFEQAFAARAARNVVLGDLNTDPVRFFDGDPSAKAFLEGATQYDLRFATEVGEDAEPTYGGLVNIDHVLSDFAMGACTSETVTSMVYFDHRPQVCTLTENQ